MEKQTTSNSKPTKNNKKTKMIFIIILFIIIAVVDFLLIYNNIKMYKQILARRDVKKEPSGLHMLITEETYDETFGENYQDKKTIYYFIFDENDICQACFAEYINIEIIPYPGNGFLNPRKDGNSTYTELPSYRGHTLEALKIIYSYAPYHRILAEW